MTDAPDGCRILGKMQERSMSAYRVVKEAEKLLPFSCEAGTVVSLKATQVSDMIAERHEFGTAIFYLMAQILGVEDPLSLTRRNTCVNRLQNAHEHNFRQDLSRLIHNGVIPADVECLQKYLLYAIASRSLPASLEEHEISTQGLKRVLNSLCPAGLVEVTAKGFKIFKPCPREAISRTAHRLKTLIGVTEDLWERIDMTPAGRRLVGQQIAGFAKEMRYSSTFEEYIEADIDWQLALSAGCPTRYQSLLVVSQSYRYAVDELRHRRQNDPSLSYPSDFALPFSEWKERLCNESLTLVEEIAKCLQRQDDKQTVVGLVSEMVTLTLNQLRALDNAFEVRRGTPAQYRLYEDVRWPLLRAFPTERTGGRKPSTRRVRGRKGQDARSAR